LVLDIAGWIYREWGDYRHAYLKRASSHQASPALEALAVGMQKVRGHRC
jgi:hypothetical protein